MTEIDLGTWEDFAEQIRNLKQKTKASLSGLLFRGHGDSNWQLNTTLERNGQRMMIVNEYYRLISNVKPLVESFTELAWEVPDYLVLEQLTRGYDFSRCLSVGDLPAYSYMLYLRHHGFPSPLLDWSRSPYVAAYFAFCRPVGDKVSIFAYCDSPDNSKFRSSDMPAIHRFGPRVPAHKRHFLQQSEYTVCALYKADWLFSPHIDVFDLDDSLEVVRQDVLCKFNLPCAERIKVLRLLDEHNLNAFSLFGSAESLMETVAFREIDFQDKG